MKKSEFKKFRKMSIDANSNMDIKGGGPGWWPYSVTVQTEDFETGLDGTDRPLQDDKLYFDTRWD
jgi:hypothetical protein